jgi:hypothetical protein
MTVYYVKQDNTVWGCGEPDCCGPTWEEIEEFFYAADIEGEVTAESLQEELGGGPVLSFREATKSEEKAYFDGRKDGFDSGYYEAYERYNQQP